MRRTNEMTNAARVIPFLAIALLALGCSTVAIPDPTRNAIPAGMSESEVELILLNAVNDQSQPEQAPSISVLVGDNSLVYSELLRRQRERNRISREWVVESIDKGKIRAGNVVRSHYLVVDVHYNEREYWVEIVDGRNLNFTGDRIHKNAVAWLGFLEDRIRQSFGAYLSRKATTPSLGVAEAWVGVYQIPGSNEAGVVVAELTRRGDQYAGAIAFRNETHGFDGLGELSGRIETDSSVTLNGPIQDAVIGKSMVSLLGQFAEGTMEGTFEQTISNRTVTGAFVLVRVTEATSRLGGIRSYRTPSSESVSFRWTSVKEGHPTLDLGSDPSGLLGPVRSNAYGPGIHADATGRPFRWRAEGGAPPLGVVRSNVYGPGIGSDATGRRVRAAPLW